MKTNYEASYLSEDREGNPMLSIMVELEGDEQYYTDWSAEGAMRDLVSFFIVHYCPLARYEHQIYTANFGTGGIRYGRTDESRRDKLPQNLGVIAFVRANLEAICKEIAGRESLKQEKSIIDAYKHAKDRFERVREITLETYKEIRDMWKEKDRDGDTV